MSQMTEINTPTYKPHKFTKQRVCKEPKLYNSTGVSENKLTANYYTIAFMIHVLYLFIVAINLAVIIVVLFLSLFFVLSLFGNFAFCCCFCRRRSRSRHRRCCYFCINSQWFAHYSQKLPCGAID